MEAYEQDMTTSTEECPIHTIRVTLQYLGYRGEFQKKVYGFARGIYVLNHFEEFDKPELFKDLENNHCDLFVDKSREDTEPGRYHDVFSCILTDKDENIHLIRHALLDTLGDLVTRIEIVDYKH